MTPSASDPPPPRPQDARPGPTRHQRTTPTGAGTGSEVYRAHSEALELVAPLSNDGPPAWHAAMRLAVHAWDANGGNSATQQDTFRTVLISYIACGVPPIDALPEFLSAYERLILEAPGDNWAFDCSALGGMLFEVAEATGRTDVVDTYRVRFIGSCEASAREGKDLTVVAHFWLGKLG